MWPRSLLMVIVLVTSARADEQANSPVRAGYEPTDRLLDFEARRRADREHGFDPMLTYVVETFAAPQLANRVVTAGLLMLEVDLALDALIGPGWGAAYIAGVAIHGRGLTDELQDVHGTSGNTAPEDVRLYEAWFEHPLGPVTVRAGVLAVDQEFLLADHSSTLLSATFGITGQFSANAIGPVYPVGAPGVSARFEQEAVTARVALFDGTQQNEHGFPTELGPDRLVLAEGTVGPLSMGMWNHDERGTGVFATLDAEVAAGLGGFARVGYSRDAPVTHYIDAGVRGTPFARRPNDLATFGIAFATTPEGPQVMMELTYELQVKWFTVQPDVQLLLLRDRSVWIGATRATIVF